MSKEENKAKRQEGKITKILANFYYVQDNENKVWECFARGRLLKEGKHLLAGDKLSFEPVGTSQGIIVDLKERKNKITKPPVANVDQVLAVFSTCEPDFDFYNLDRYLSYIRYELPVEEINICVNKIDLKKINVDKTYEKSNCKVIYVSALTKEGFETLKDKLVNKTTVLAGPSGVGKSSIIKALAPQEDIKIGSLSAIKTGKHITRNVQLIAVNVDGNKGFLVDTPGFTQLNFAGLDSGRLLTTFPELKNLGCNFSNCLHYDEEDCKAEVLVDSGILEQSRYQSYKNILEEVYSEIIYTKKTESKIKSIGGRKGKNKFLPKIDSRLRSKSRKKERQGLIKMHREIEEN